MSRWSAEEDALLQALYPVRSAQDLAALLPGRSQSAIYNRAIGVLLLSKDPAYLQGMRQSKLDRLRQAGLLAHYQPGHQPWNKGLKLAHGRRPPGSFEPGNTPHTLLPLGTERWRKGFLWRKVEDVRGEHSRKGWRPVHHLMWQEANGTIPGNHVVMFLDGDQSNLSMDNLACVHRSVMAWLNQHGFSAMGTPELGRAAIALAELEMARNRRDPTFRRGGGVAKDPGGDSCAT